MVNTKNKEIKEYFKTNLDTLKDISIKELAFKFGVGEKTICRWRKEFNIVKTQVRSLIVDIDFKKREKAREFLKKKANSHIPMTIIQLSEYFKLGKTQIYHWVHTYNITFNKQKRGLNKKTLLAIEEKKSKRAIRESLAIKVRDLKNQGYSNIKLMQEFNLEYKEICNLLGLKEEIKLNNIKNKIKKPSNNYFVGVSLFEQKHRSY